MGNPFDDPELHRRLGLLCLRFALLEGSLSFSLQCIAGITEPAVALSMIYREAVRKKIEMIEAIVLDRLTARPAAVPGWNGVRIKALTKALTDVSERRNAIVHGWWTVELGPLNVVEGSLESGTLRAKAEPIRALVKKFAKRPGQARTYFPDEMTPQLLEDIRSANSELQQLLNDFMDAKRTRGRT